MSVNKGDFCRVIQDRCKGKLGETIWEVVEKPYPDRPMIFIREAGTDYSTQQFDTSLVQRCDREGRPV